VVAWRKGFSKAWVQGNRDLTALGTRASEWLESNG
jgi:hypothetical protein